MYQSLEAELHDAFWDAEGPSAELPLLRTFLKKHPGSCLEIGCGSGRLLLPLLAEGFAVDGLDNAPEMIRRCRHRAAEEGLAPFLYEEELAEHAPAKLYQSVTLPAFTLQLFENPAEALKLIHGLLAPGGGLYLTVFYPWAEELGELPANERYPDHAITLPDGSKASIETEHHLDGEALLLTRNHYYEIRRSNGMVDRYHSKQRLRYCLPEEWQTLLEDSGFHVTEIIEDFTPAQKDEDGGAGISTFFATKKGE